MVDIQNMAIGGHIDIVMRVVREASEFIHVVCLVMVDACRVNIDYGYVMFRGGQNRLGYFRNGDSGNPQFDVGLMIF